ncbi:MAG: L,D-transpeptidase [Longimicrobiales bacterium]
MNRNRWILAIVLFVVGAFGAAGIRLPIESAVTDPTELPDAPLVLVLNLPAFRLDVYERGERTRSFVVSVGARGHETPVGDYTVKRAIWNPWWHPPDSEWAKDEKPMPPGPANPMGRVKLFFTGLYYIHGSPLEGSIGEAASHGCIRMRNRDVIELARLVHSYASEDVGQRTLERLIEDRDATRTIRLDRPVPLLVTYDLAEMRDGHLVLYPDVYGLARVSKRDAALAVLARAGYDASRIDRSWLASQIRESERRTVVVHADELRAAAPISVGVVETRSSL